MGTSSLSQPLVKPNGYKIYASGAQIEVPCKAKEKSIKWLALENIDREGEGYHLLHILTDYHMGEITHREM